MSSSQLLVWLVVAIGFGFAGWGIGKGKGRPTLGAWLGFLLGLIGVIIIACIPKTQAAKLAEEQHRYQVQGAWNGGYPYPPQQPYAPYPPPSQGPYAPYPPPGQEPDPRQPPPGQWQQQPSPPPWEQSPPNPWPGSPQ